MRINPQLNDITCTINANTQKQYSVCFNRKIKQFQIGLFNFDFVQPYKLPSNIVTSNICLNFMKQFVECHEYTPQNIKIDKPLKTFELNKIFDAKTLNLVKKFTLIENMKQAMQIVQLAHFLQFQLLEDAVGIALISNFWNNLKNGQMQQSHTLVRNKFTEQQFIQKQQLEIVDLLISYEKIVMMGESIEKEQLYEKYLKQFCTSSYGFTAFTSI